MLNPISFGYHKTCCGQALKQKLALRSGLAQTRNTKQGTRYHSSFIKQPSSNSRSGAADVLKDAVRAMGLLKLEDLLEERAVGVLRGDQVPGRLCAAQVAEVAVGDPLGEALTERVVV